MQELNLNESEQLPSGCLSKLISIKRARTIYSVDCLVSKFPEELKKLGNRLDDLIANNEKFDLISISKIIGKLKPNTVVYTDKNENTSLLIDVDVKVRDYILVRQDKLLGSGTWEEMTSLLVERMQKDYPGHYNELKPEELDESSIFAISEEKYKHGRAIKIISIQ